jgi:large subunit ribosomal protein L44
MLYFFLESQTREIHRWVRPTLHEIRRRKRIVGKLPEPRRSDFIDWNYEAEIYAFGIRLHEKFSPKDEAKGCWH